MRYVRMKKLLRIATSLFVLLCAPAITFAMEQETLQKAWEKEEAQGFSSVDAQILANKHIIFVAGFMNELTDLLGNYFDDNKRAVERFGGTHSYIGPSSKLSIAENANLIYKQIVGIAHREQKPLILVGHSKGGATILHILYEHPELILNGYVDKALLIQAALGGSPLADNASGIFFTMMSSILSPNTNTLSMNTSLSTFNSAHSLYKIGLKTFAKDAILSKKDLHKCISSRIFYVRSQTDKELSFGLKLILGVLQDTADNYFKNHDGLLSLDAQFDPRVGIDLGIVRADHIDLTVSIVSNVSSQRREAFMRAAFKAMYSQEDFYIYQ